MVEDDFEDNPIRLELSFFFIGVGCEQDLEEDFNGLDWPLVVDNGVVFIDLDADLDGLFLDPFESLFDFFDSLFMEEDTHRTLRFLPCPSICNSSVPESA